MISISPFISSANYYDNYALIPKDALKNSLIGANLVANFSIAFEYFNSISHRS